MLRSGVISPNKFYNQNNTMKNFLSIAILFFVAAVNSYGQYAKEQETTMSLGNKYSYYVEIDGLSKKDAEKAWKDYVQSFGKMKYNKKAKEYYLNGAKVPMINGTNTVDLYTRIEEGKDQATVYTWVDLGGAFANPQENAQAAEGCRTFMNDFWVYGRKIAVGNELAAEEKTQKDLEKDLTKLEGKNQDYHDEIEKLREKIRQAEANIEQNLKDQDDKKVAIAQQRKKVEKVVDKLNNVGKE